MKLARGPTLDRPLRTLAATELIGKWSDNQTYCLFEVRLRIGLCRIESPRSNLASISSDQDRGCSGINNTRYERFAEVRSRAISGSILRSLMIANTQCCSSIIPNRIGSIRNLESFRSWYSQSVVSIVLLSSVRGLHLMEGYDDYIVDEHPLLCLQIGSDRFNFLGRDHSFDTDCGIAPASIS